MNALDIPEPIRLAFSAHAFLTLGQLATVIGIDEKTLRAHVLAGHLTYIRFGAGEKRPRRLFGPAHVASFLASLQRRDAPCPSTAPKTRRESRARRSGSTTSSSEVVDFMARREQRRGPKRGA